MTTSPLVSRTREGAVCIISMDDVDGGNAITIPMSLALAEAFEVVAREPDVHCVVLRSSSRHFSTGGSVEDMHRGSDLMEGPPERVAARIRSGLHRITLATQAVDVPIIAAVNGAAVGAGFDIAMMCDIRLAGERARFAESFLRLGLISGIGGAWFLTRTVGLSRAMEMTLTSEFLDAPAALAAGIVSRVTPPESLDAAALELAAKIASAPPTALRMAKRLVRESASSTLSAALEMAASQQAILLASAEHKSAVARFLAR